jgi:hypothetical protein
VQTSPARTARDRDPRSQHDWCVFRFAIATGRAERDSTADLRGALITPTVTHRATIVGPKAVGACQSAFKFEHREEAPATLQNAIFVVDDEARKYLELTADIIARVLFARASNEMRPMDEGDVSVIAIAWYEPEEWADLKRLCPDLHDTYEEWLSSVETTIAALGSSPKEQIVKTVLTVDELRRWKRATGRDVDGKVRSQLAIKAAKRKYPSA